MRAGITRLCLAGARYCASMAFTLAVWTTWLVLVVLLLSQAYVGTVNELRVPRFLLHAIEDHLAQSGVTMEFGRATFDPSGRVLLQKARFRLATFGEPIVTADTIYIRLNTLALIERRFEASEIRATGANLFIPAMLSASGRAEKLVQDLDAGFSITSRGDEFSVDHLSCRLGGVCVSARGQINAGTMARNAGAGASLPLAEFVSRNYAALSREFSRAEEHMAGLDHAVLTADLTPSDTRGAIVTAELYADGLTMPKAPAIEAGGLHATCRFPLLGGAPTMTAAVASAATLRVGGKFAATGVRARIRGILQMDTLAFDPRQLDVTAGTASFGYAYLVAPIARLVPGSKGALEGEAAAVLFGRPIRVQGRVDLSAQSADVNFDASLAPEITEALSKRIGTNVRRFADLSEPLEAAGRIRFLPGWRFADVKARVDTRNFIAYKVKFDGARGVVTYDGTRLAARGATAVSGDNLAYGSYEQDFSTRAFRYLLSGRLRPLYISPWFGGAWWPNIFGNFDFPGRPADATIDVQGRYVRGANFSVFGYADSEGPVIRGVAFDKARVLLYIDQLACDGLEINLSQGGGTAQGSFRLSTDPRKGTWSAFDIDARSAIDPVPLGKILPPDGAEAISAFSFDHAPSLYVSGHFDGPAAPAPRHKELYVELRSDSALRVHGVVLERASFRLRLKDDDIDISDVTAGFAGGVATGSAQVTGADADKRLRFKASLNGASLGQAAAAAQGFVVSGTPGSSTALGTFAKDKSGVRLDLNASAEGRPSEIGTFAGNGNFQVQGANLGEVSLLGGLSRVLKFPELRFTQARSSIKIENGSLEFPDLTVIGANSQIRAKGTYAIDRRILKFSATIYPFMESRSLLQIFNAISAPLSAVFRVRLSGSIDKPSWGLAYSPLNLMREGEPRPGSIDKTAPPTPLANPPP